MLGATSAFRRDEHMRLSALTSRLHPRTAEICDIVNTVLIVIFTIELLIAVVWPSFIPETSSLAELLKSAFTGDFFASAYFGQEFTDLLPAMQIPRAIATGGIVFGVAMMLLIALCRLAESERALTLKVVAIVLAACVMVYLGRGLFHGLGNANLVLFFVVFVAVEIAIGMPIAFAFGIATLNYLGVVTDLPLSVIAGQMDQGMSNQVLLAVPLFVLLGLLIENAGIAKRLIEAISAFCGHLRGGLNIVLVVAMFLVSGISGS